MTPGDSEAPELLADVTHDLETVLSDAYFSMPDEASALLQLLMNPHIRALADCLREIATENFFTPTLPSSGLFAVDGTVNNLPQAVYNDTLRGVPSLSRRDLVNQKASSLGSGNGLNGASGTGAKLTGGGEALPMKPVDDGDLRLISFKRNAGEDLVGVGCMYFRSDGWELSELDFLPFRASQ